MRRHGSRAARVPHECRLCDPSPMQEPSGRQRRAIVTGAASGIGRATVERLRGDGWRVIGIDRNGQATSDHVVGDVGDERVLAAALERAGGVLDALVCSAGLRPKNAQLNASIIEAPAGGGPLMRFPSCCIRCTSGL